MLRRFWQWYFWNAAPTPYATRRSRLRCWLWWHTHPRWLRNVRTALLAYHTMQEDARHRARVGGESEQRSPQPGNETWSGAKWPR